MNQAGVLQKAAMDQPRRLRRLADRAHQTRRGELVLARVLASPAGGALEAGRQLLGVGDEQQRRPADAHRADRDRLARVGGLAGFQRRSVVGDRVGAHEPLGRRKRVEAGGGAVVLGGARRRERRGESGGEEETDEASRQGLSPKFAPPARVPCHEQEISAASAPFCGLASQPSKADARRLQAGMLQKVKGFGRRPQHDMVCRRGAGVRKPPKEETAGRMGSVWPRATYGDLKVTGGLSASARDRVTSVLAVWTKASGAFGLGRVGVWRERGAGSGLAGRAKTASACSGARPEWKKVGVARQEARRRS